MALTIYQQPNSITLKTSDNYITALSNNVTSYSDFNYKIYQYDTNLNPNFSEYIELNQLPTPKSFCIYNPNDFTYLNENILDITNFLYHNSSSYSVVGVKIFENYNSTNYSSGATKQILFLNGEEDANEIEFNGLEYQHRDENSKLLTDFEYTRLITLNSYNFISMLNGRNYPLLGSGFTTALDIENYNNYIYFDVYLKVPENRIGATGTYTAFRGYIKNQYSGGTELKLDINLNIDKINSDHEIKITQIYRNNTWSNFSYTINTATTEFINDNCKFFDIYTTESTTYTSQRSKKYRFKIIDECNNLLDTYNIVWFNRLGGLESFNFKGYVENTFSIKKDEYQKQSIEIDTSTGLINKTFYDRDYYINNREIDDKIKIVTGNISTEYGKLFQDMLKSTGVYLIQNEIKIPIRILTNSISYKNEKTTGLTNFQFEITRNIRKKYRKF